VLQKPLFCWGLASFLGKTLRQNLTDFLSKLQPCEAEFEQLQSRFEATGEYLRNLIEMELNKYKKGDWSKLVALKAEDDEDL